jgi:hypothetical protein
MSGIERTLPALSHPVEHHPDSSDGAGIGVEYPAGDVDGLGVDGDGKDGEDGEDGEATD